MSSLSSFCLFFYKLLSYRWRVFYILLAFQLICFFIWISAQGEWVFVPCKATMLFVLMSNCHSRAVRLHYLSIHSPLSFVMVCLSIRFEVSLSSQERLCIVDKNNLFMVIERRTAALLTWLMKSLVHCF